MLLFAWAILFNNKQEREDKNMEEKKICIFCGKELKESESNNAEPFLLDGDKNNVCCSDCNNNIVIPTRTRIKK